VASDQRYAMNLLQEAKRIGLAEEALKLIDSCVTKNDPGTGTSTKLMDWARARDLLQTLIAKASRRAAEAMVKEEK
jgi:hypothetical protein